MKKIMILLFVLICSTTTADAQNYFQLQLGFGFPSGDFADDNYNNAIFKGDGYASTGFNLGIKYYYPLEVEGLSMVLGVNIFYNPLDADCKDKLEDVWDDVKFSKYINIPIMFGVNYKISVHEKISFFGEGSLGVNILKITNLKMENDYYNTDLEINFHPSFKLSYAIGMGILFQDKYSLGLHYYGLGSHKCKYEEIFDTTEKEDKKFDRALDISILSLTFGIKLGK